ncbi:hypothetical protein RHMOL_Rhmol13G0208000 [Rhododendron molle]|uniref:Uncharacterized protein n=1 Tax=Rhododendron molle TaxID=49168 RepID=A0ACC0LA06_RHOML|nr:hypothetical protein RHMOL_Rhmol13G0208000 [Rhododendron molle]
MCNSLCSIRAGGDWRFWQAVVDSVVLDPACGGGGVVDNRDVIKQQTEHKRKKKSNPASETKHCFALETAIDGPKQGNNARKQNRPDLLPENPNNTAATTGNPQEAPPTPPSTTAVLTPTTHQTPTT